MLVIDWMSLKLKLTKDKGAKPPMGMRVYIGPQGHGKTLSMVHDAKKLKEQFPKLYVISNLDLKFADEVVHGTKKLTQALRKDNGENGVLMIIDELQLFASKKQGIGYDVFQALCQQRKKRRFLMGTAQDWEDLDVSSRKKVAEVVKTHRICNIQINKIFDGYSIKYDQKLGEWTCKQKGTSIFKHNDKLYKSYDTYAEISTRDEFVTDNKVVQQTLPQASMPRGGGACGKVSK